MSVSTFDDLYSEGSPHASRLRALAQARRHSRWVRLLRVLLPASAIVVPLTVIVPIVLEPESMLPEVDLGAITLSSNAITMERPRLTGFSDTRRAYEVTAERAEQTLANSQDLRLFGLSGRMELDDGGSAVLAAGRGQLATKTQLLDLSEGIRLDTSKGDRVAMSRAHIAFGTSAITTDVPVEITTSSMRLTSDRMQILDGGSQAVFEGRVVMVLQPEGGREPEQKP